MPSEREPPARRGAAAKAIKGAVYLYGGSGRDGLFDDLWVLTDTEVWTEVDFGGGDVPRPLACTEHVLARWGDDLLLVGGQLADPLAGQPIWKFETMRRRWSILDPKPVHRSRHSAIVLNDAALLIAGGCADTPIDFAKPPVSPRPPPPFLLPR